MSNWTYCCLLIFLFPDQQCSYKTLPENYDNLGHKISNKESDTDIIP